MAITFQKQPLAFFNVNEPAIFEFTSDQDLGVNPNDLVADLELKSMWSNRRYVIKNILPKYGTGVFRVDVQGYLKSLMLDGFNYDWNGLKIYAIERFSIGVSVHAENAVEEMADSYVFDTGYIFDETFIFADDTPNDTKIETGFYPVVGMTYRSEQPKPLKDPTKINLLSPTFAEFAVGFENNVHILVGDNVDVPGTKTISVNGITRNIPNTRGVAFTRLSEAQIQQMQIPTLIKVDTLDNPAIKVYGVAYNAENCESTLQFRFYNSYGGYSYFYAPKEGRRANRSKSDFINNAFYNQQDGRSSEVQRSLDYSETFNITGVKRLELQELYRELLRSPKIEVLLPQGLTECEVKGDFNARELDFEFTLTVTLSNRLQMSL